MSICDSVQVCSLVPTLILTSGFKILSCYGYMEVFLPVGLNNHPLLPPNGVIIDVFVHMFINKFAQ